MKNEQNLTNQEVINKPEETEFVPKNVFQYLLLFVEGIIIGVGAILPGISGGVLCVMFGIYRPMMRFLASPIKRFIKSFKLLCPVGIGVAVGFVGLSGLIADLAKQNETIVTSAFVGLIIGMLPSLFRDVKNTEKPKSSMLAMLISGVALLALFLLIQSQIGVQMEQTMWAFLLCGVLWGISLIVPGMSSSSLLIFLGLYYPMSDGISTFEPIVIIPLFVGIILTLLLLVRGVNFLLDKCYGIVVGSILGFVIASTIPIIPIKFASTSELLISILCAVVGFAIAIAMDIWGQKVKKD